MIKDYRTMRITPATHRTLRILAANTGESMIELIARLAEEAAERQATPPAPRYTEPEPEPLTPDMEE